MSEEAAPSSPDASAAQTRVEQEPTLADVKTRLRARLPKGADPDELAEAWLRAVTQQAISANVSPGAPPTTLMGARADLLMHLCKQLKRLVSERETEVLLRLSPTSARSAHRLMKAIYEDVLYEYILDWALRDASFDGKGKFQGVQGDRVIFKTKDALEAAVAELGRVGWATARRRDDENNPYLLYVEKAAGLSARAVNRAGRNGRRAE